MTQIFMMLILVTLVLMIVIVVEIKTTAQVLKPEVAQDYERVMQRLENPKSWEDIDSQIWRMRKRKKNGDSAGNA